MSTLLPSEKTLGFPAFWQWLQDHPNCILGAGWGQAVLFDQADLHWELFEEEERQVVVQLIKGKSPVAELVMDAREIDEVQLGPDPEGADRGQFLAELLTSPSKGREVIGHFVLAHGMDQTRGHTEMRH